MQVDVISSVNEARTDELLHKTVIVIDVLRATSTVVSALDNGGACIIPVETVSQAKQCQSLGDLLGGERYCKKIAGFHFGNSPLEYTEQHVKDRRIILTTTNGTRAVQKAQRAAIVLAGCLRNAASCAETAVSFGKDIAVLCSGTRDEFSLEDGLCAGLLVERIVQFVGNQSRARVSTNDLGMALRFAYLHQQDDITSTLLESSNGKRLARLGYREDVVYCSEVDVTTMVPILDQGMLVPFSCSAQARTLPR
ncbi:2-phosphosulfolactate phosphatase [Paenibacillus swuensis]|uniref:Probable 2-phosphosulfolactate phosphatase n=1 Tax=Paenibacillus swuensis TaxID=1178515 RepID=A0A172TM74_9BACL|nr:2-phosphosulfolactate phosphatase [Paenibacillus swuensis]ANE48082.1 2-phosphosulfolactate phosphatase [Paenibacillus swuensis]